MAGELCEVFREGAEAAEAILRDVYRVDVTKALDPLDRTDFLTIVQRLSSALRGVTRSAEADALRRAIRELDVDWPHLSGEAHGEVIRASRQALESLATQVLPQVNQVFEVEADRVVRASKKATVRRFELSIGTDLSRTDERIARFVRESQGNFVRDEYGRRREAFSKRAREIVASGIEGGVGRDDISEALSTSLAEQGLTRSRAYWDMVSMVFANRARTTTELAAFEEAGIEQYRFEAVLDEVTSEVCRFMHGRVFTVAKAMDRFRKGERARDPELIRETQPFIQVGADEDGNEVLFYERGDRRRTVARVDEAGFGERDAVGSYSDGLSNKQLEAAGVSAPPLHGQCRSTIVAEV
ncbi:MAG: hypothetical protein HY901_36945 [Deltaproteobacteria bacterium]|nr:hypothetical protein [Deltaproteobacteria bacterium]